MEHTIANAFYLEVDAHKDKDGMTEETIIQVIDESFRGKLQSNSLIDTPKHWELVLVFIDNSVMKITRSAKEYAFQEGEYIPPNRYS